MPLEKTKQTILVTALSRLKESLDSNKTVTKQFYTYIRDSIIKRFEFCFNLFVQALIKELARTHSTVTTNPQAVFKSAFQDNLVNKNEFEQCLKMLNDRRKTRYCYDETVAHVIAEHVFSYHQTMSIIAQRLD